MRLLLLMFHGHTQEKSLRLIVGLASFHPRLRNRNVRTFEDLASYPFDKVGRIFILTNMLILAYGAMLAYLLIIKDTVPPIVRSILHLHTTNNSVYQNAVLIVSSVVVILPLALKRDMASLSIFSSFSVSADVILTIFIIAYAPIRSSVHSAGGLGYILSHHAIQPSTLFIAVGILSTAMSCQHSCFIISESLSNKTQKRWAKVTGSSLLVAGFLTAVLGVAGYLGFGEKTQGDVLNNFDQDHYEANFARFLLAITMFFTYPMESFVARHVLVVLFHDGDMDGHHLNENATDDTTLSPQNNICFCFSRRHILSMSIFLATLLPAVILSDIGPVLSITGSIGGSCLCYIAPGLVYLGVNGDEFLSWTEQALNSYYGRKKNGKATNQKITENDLPIQGSANTILSSNQSVSNMELPLDGDASNILVTLPKNTRLKPFWWYIGLFPIWCAIARTGKSNMLQRCGTMTDTSIMDADSEHLKPPTFLDYIYAMIFILFGVISVVAGVVTNIWFLLKK